MHKNYRADIDGLRALAVISVILYHINSNFLPGGFVGVDIFFVISGFVITKSILANIQQFSWLTFYCRRVKRILPMMFVMLFTILLLAIMLDVKDDDVFYTADSTKAVATYVYNIYLIFHNTGYFELPSQQQPVLHMWSLSIEEQFYLLFPLICYFGYKKSIARTNYFLIIMIFISILFSEYALMKSWNNIAYYSLMSRAYELSTGVLLAGYQFKVLNRYKIMSGLLSIIGVLSIFYSMIFLSGKPFPGIWGLVPTLGISLLLIGGIYPNMISKLLSIYPLRFIGKISYSLYLWHWVVISFYKYEVVLFNPSFKSAMGMLLIMFILATLSYLYIEMPLRYNSTTSVKSTILRYQIYPLAIFLISATAITIMTRTGGLVKYTMKHKLWQENRPPHGFCHGGDLVGDCVFGDIKNHSEPKIAVYGDSHAGAIAPFLDEFGKLKKKKMYMRSNGGCTPLVIDDAVVKENWLPEGMKKWCLLQDREMIANLYKYDVIMLVAYWPKDLNMVKGSYDLLKEMHHTIDYLLARGKRVVLFGDVPVYIDGTVQQVSRREKLRQYLPFLPLADINFTAQNFSTNEKLANLVAEYKGKEVYFFNTQAEITSKINSYPYIHDYIIYGDPNHLNPHGALELIKYTNVYNSSSISKLNMILSTNNKIVVSGEHTSIVREKQ